MGASLTSGGRLRRNVPCCVAFIIYHCIIITLFLSFLLSGYLLIFLRKWKCLEVNVTLISSTSRYMQWLSWFHMSNLSNFWKFELLGYWITFLKLLLLTTGAMEIHISASDTVKWPITGPCIKMKVIKLKVWVYGNQVIQMRSCQCQSANVPMQFRCLTISKLETRFHKEEQEKGISSTWQEQVHCTA